MKKILKVIVQVCKWLTLLPKILDMVEAFARDNNKDSSNTNSNNTH